MGGGILEVPANDTRPAGVERDASPIPRGRSNHSQMPRRQHHSLYPKLNRNNIRLDD